MLKDSLKVIETYPWFQALTTKAQVLTIRGAAGAFHITALNDVNSPSFYSTKASYPFLGFQFSINVNLYVFYLGETALWHIHADNGDDFKKLGQAFQLVALGSMPLRDALHQVFLSSSDTDYVYNKSVSLAANFLSFSEFIYSHPSDNNQSQSATLFTQMAVNQLCDFFSERVAELAKLSTLDYTVANASELSPEESMFLHDNPFIRSAICNKKDIFSNFKDNSYKLEGETGSLLATLLCNNSSSMMDKKEACALNALEITRQNSKAGFIYDLLRIHDGGRYFEGEEVPNPIEVLKDAGVSEVVGDEKLSELASSLSSLKSDLYDDLVVPPIAPIEIKDFEPTLKKRFQSVSAFWYRFLHTK